MTKDDIIRMAREAGFADSEGVVHTAYQLEAFANLVAVAEREKYAKFFDLNDTILFWGSQVAEHIRRKSQS